jgi:hypothetical protein
MKEKQPLFIFALEQNQKYGSETKRKEKYGSKTKQKKNTEDKNDAKRKIRK